MIRISRNQSFPGMVMTDIALVPSVGQEKK